MELPSGFTDRVDRLRDPHGFVDRMVALLSDAENAATARREAGRLLLDSLSPDARRRYLEIVNPNLAQTIKTGGWRLSPESAAFKRRIEERLRSKDRAVLAKREQWRREWESQTARIEAEYEAEGKEIEARLRDAGLPVIPQLIEWLRGPDGTYRLLLRAGKSEGTDDESR